MLEGISTSGKTTLFNTLKQKHICENSERTLLALSEHYTQIRHKSEDDYFLMPKDKHLEFLEKKISFLEDLAKFGDSLGDASMQSRGIFYILERFHLNHMVAYDDISSKFQSRLASLNPLTILVTVAKEDVLKRLINRFPTASNAEIKEKCDNLLKEQDRYWEKFATINSPKFLLLNSEKSKESLVEEVFGKLKGI